MWHSHIIQFYSYLKRISEPLSKLIIKAMFTGKGMMQKKMSVYVNLKTLNSTICYLGIHIKNRLNKNKVPNTVVSGEGQEVKLFKVNVLISQQH